MNKMISPDALRVLLNPTNRILKILDSIDALMVGRMLDQPQVVGDVTLSMYGRTIAMTGTFSKDTREKVKEFLVQKGYSCKAFETRILFSIPIIECECHAECNAESECTGSPPDLSYFY